MATFLREIYEVLSCFSTATHTEMCNDLLRQLTAKSGDNLAGYFADALEANKVFSQIERPFILDTRSNKAGTNPVAGALAKASPLTVTTTSAVPYEFTFLQREVPHLRAATKEEQHDKGWIDYVARTKDRPILGEVKWKDDKNPFYAFVQLLTYLSEIATPDQIARSVRHDLFGKDIPSLSAFDLHIVLANFNDRGDKGKLIGPTQQLASAFKDRLQNEHPATATCLGHVLCISAHIEEESESIKEMKCNWMV
jgi:hypothetical protein